MEEVIQQTREFVLAHVNVGGLHRIRLGVAILFLSFCCCTGGHKHENNSQDIVSDSLMLEAYHQFKELIAVADSNQHAWAKESYWDIPKSELKERVQTWTVYASRVSSCSQKAAVLIAPYDSVLFYKAMTAAEIADNGVFYANRYLEGRGEGFADKSLVEAGHVYTYLQDIKVVLSD